MKSYGKARTISIFKTSHSRHSELQTMCNKRQRRFLLPKTKQEHKITRCDIRKGTAIFKTICEIKKIKTNNAAAVFLLSQLEGPFLATLLVWQPRSFSNLALGLFMRTLWAHESLVSTVLEKKPASSLEDLIILVMKML